MKRGSEPKPSQPEPAPRGDRTTEVIVSLDRGGLSDRSLERRLPDRLSPSVEPVQDPAKARLLYQRFGRYELLFKLGAGGMASLYLARLLGPQNFEKFIAIKKIHDHLATERSFVDMFLDEAKISAKIHHPNVAQIFDFGEAEGTYFLALEYVHGIDLAMLLNATARTSCEKFDFTYVTRIVADAAAGLHAAHEITGADGKLLGLVHRDVSPQNILISYDGHVKVVDFGVAYAAEKISQTRAGTIKGKAAYMSPEQSNGLPVDRRTDVFALGILLYEGCCRRRLFLRDSEAATMRAVSAAQVPPPRSFSPDIPNTLEAIMLKALAKRPDDRFQTAGELQETLEDFLVSRGEAIGASKVAWLLDGLFGKEKDARNQLLRRAGRSADSSGVTDELSVGGPSETPASARGTGDSEGAAPRPRRRRVLGILGVAAALGVAALAFAVLRDNSLPGPDQPLKAIAPPALTAADLDPVGIRLTLVVNPVDARLFINGKVIRIGQGQAKRVIPVPRGTTPLVLLITADGYHPEQRSLTPSQDLTEAILLRRRDAASAAVDGAKRDGARRPGERPGSAAEPRARPTPHRGHRGPRRPPMRAMANGSMADGRGGGVGSMVGFD